MRGRIKRTGKDKAKQFTVKINNDLTKIEKKSTEKTSAFCTTFFFCYSSVNVVAKQTKTLAFLVINTIQSLNATGYKSIQCGYYVISAVNSCAIITI